MGVYIKGMEMPKSCIDCPLYRYTAVSHYCCMAAIRGQKATERDKNCPLVEVKTPHGRLIDADDYKKLLADDTKLWVLEHTPTVIEAEEE